MPQTFADLIRERGGMRSEPPRPRTFADVIQEHQNPAVEPVMPAPPVEPTAYTGPPATPEPIPQATPDMQAPPFHGPYIQPQQPPVAPVPSAPPVQTVAQPPVISGRYQQQPDTGLWVDSQTSDWFTSNPDDFKPIHVPIPISPENSLRTITHNARVNGPPQPLSDTVKQIARQYPDRVKAWLTKGEIGPVEQLAEKQDWTEALPFSPEAMVKSGELLQAVNRLKSNDYKRTFSPMDVVSPGAGFQMPYAMKDNTPKEAEKVREKDLDLVGSYLLQKAEEEVRGRNMGGAVAQGVAAMPSFMAEFMLTGGGKKIAEKAVTKVVQKLIGRAAGKGIGKLATKTARWVAGGVVRTAMMPHRVGENTLERMIPKEMEITDKGELLAKEGEKPFTALWKGFGDTLIENLSEESGAAIGKAGKKLLPKRLAQGITAAFTKLHPSEPIQRIATRAGWNGFLEEMGEERLGSLMRAVTGVEDFGTGKTGYTAGDIMDRLVASVPSADELMVEAGVLAVPGATNVAVGMASDAMGRKSPQNAPESKEPSVPPKQAETTAPSGSQAPPTVQKGGTPYEDRSGAEAINEPTGMEDFTDEQVIAARKRFPTVEPAKTELTRRGLKDPVGDAKPKQEASISPSVSPNAKNDTQTPLRIVDETQIKKPTDLTGGVVSAETKPFGPEGKVSVTDPDEYYKSELKKIQQKNFRKEAKELLEDNRYRTDDVTDEDIISYGDQLEQEAIYAAAKNREIMRIRDYAEKGGWKITNEKGYESGSRYLTLENPGTGDEITVRISDHAQAKGGGFNMQTGERHGSADINFILDTPDAKTDLSRFLKGENDAGDEIPIIGKQESINAPARNPNEIGPVAGGPNVEKSLPEVVPNAGTPAGAKPGDVGGEVTPEEIATEEIERYEQQNPGYIVNVDRAKLSLPGYDPRNIDNERKFYGRAADPVGEEAKPEANEAGKQPTQTPKSEPQIPLQSTGEPQTGVPKEGLRKTSESDIIPPMAQEPRASRTPQPEETPKREAEIPKKSLPDKDVSEILQISDLYRPREKYVGEFDKLAKRLKQQGHDYFDAYHITSADPDILSNEGIIGTECDYIGRSEGNVRPASVYLFLDSSDISKGLGGINGVPSGEKTVNIVHLKIPIEEIKRLYWDANYNVTFGTYSSARIEGSVKPSWISSTTKYDITKFQKSFNPPAPEEGGVSTRREESPLPDGEKEVEATTGLSDRIADHLDSGKSLDANTFFSMADEHYGGTRAEGKYGPSEAYDELELGINKYLKRKGFNPAVDGKTAMKDLRQIEELLSKLPTQTNRSGEKDKMQQFSTPPHYAYAVNWLANIKPSDRVLEPSAGVGGLAVFAKNAGATVQGNELSERRRELLKQLGIDEITGEDAEQIHNILPMEKRPTVVVMNPPFSQAAHRVKTQKIIGTDLKHIEAALQYLQDGGRLVAIMGDSLHGGESQRFRDWVSGIQKKYHFRAIVSIADRNIYKKYGTSFPTKVLVIDKVNNPLVGQAPLRKSVESLDDMMYTLQEVRNERPQLEPARSEPPVRKTAPAAETAPVRNERPGPESGDLGAGESRPGVRGTVEPVPVEPSGAGESNAELEPGPSDADAGAGPGRQGSERTGESGTPADEESGSRGSRGDPDRKPVREPSSDSTGVSVKFKEKTGLSDNLYEAYSPAKVHTRGARKHPASLVESAAMAAVESPDVTYQTHIPQEVIDRGALSDAQMETITYAGQAHETMLPDGKRRRGYMIGDGTGVGKGREIAGILLDNFEQGRTRAVWISENKKLYEDAKRDWSALRQDPAQVHNFEKVTKDQPIPHKLGVLYTTYHSLASKPKTQGFKTRLEKLVDWLGKDFDGVIVFDEAHNMANSISVKGKRGRTKPSQMALAGDELRAKMPNARIVYVSATAATEVRNLAYADRLGLWGPHTSFSDRVDFINKVTNGGVAAMEMVARDMKALGVYLARNISFNDGTPEGTVQYNRLEHTLTENQRDVYDKLAEGWQAVLANFNDAIEIIGAAKGGEARKNAMSQFWGANQRFWNQIITAMQTPSVIRSIEKDMAEGRSAVIQLTSTYEAAQDRALADREEGEDLDDFDLTPRDILMQMVEHSFPVNEHEEYEDENGNIRSRPVKDSKGNFVQNRQAVEMRDKLLDQLASLSVPESPMDMILNHFGTDQVSEVTGRKRRVVMKNGKKIIDKRPPATTNPVEIQKFMDGKKRILIFSEAGGTGASYHASLDYENQQQRSHYLLQAGWRADRAIQGLGRTHRSNQKQAPIYHLVATDLKGQKRFISTIARKLDQLGALTKGTRKAGSSGMFQAADNLESTEAKEALRTFFKDLYNGKVDGITLAEFQEQTGLELVDKEGQLRQDLPEITQFLNRVLSMKIEKQNQVFGQYESRLEAKVRQAIADGTLDQGMETLKADKIEVEDEQVVYTEPRTGAKTHYVKLKVSNRNEPRPFDEILSKKPLFFVKNKHGTIYAVSPYRDATDAETGDIIKRYRLDKPMDWHPIPQDSLSNAEQWTKVSTEEARTLWDKAVAKIPEYDTSTRHLITGVILPIWDRLPDGHTRVFRLQTEDGRQMLGRVIEEEQIETVLNRLGAEHKQSELSTEDLLLKAVSGKAHIILSNGWKIARAVVHGEPRLEITGPYYAYDGEMDQDGVYSERIQYKKRYFIPTGETMREVFEKVIQDHPVAEVKTYSGSGDKLPPVPGEEEDFGGREGGSTILSTELAEEIVGVVKKLADVVIHGAGSVKNILQSHVLRGTAFISRFGKAGWKLSRDIKEIDKAAAKRINNNELDAAKLLQKLNRKQREQVAKAVNGRLRNVPDYIQARADRLREILDRDMEEAAELGRMRTMPDGTEIPLGGSGKAFPQVPNKKGLEFLEFAKEMGLANPTVAQVCSDMVESGEFETLEDALVALVQYRDAFVSGRNSYFDQTRVELPEHYIEWDPAKVLPGHFERSGRTVEGTRKWGPKFEKAYYLVKAIEAKDPAAAHDINDFLRIMFDHDMSLVPKGSRYVAGLMGNWQTLGKLGYSFLSAIRNMGQRFTNTSEQPILSVILPAVADMPPFLSRIMPKAMALREQILRTGAVRSHAEMSSIESGVPGERVTGAAMKLFSSVEEGNQTFAALVAGRGLVNDIVRLQRLQKNGNLMKILKAVFSLGEVREEELTRRIRKTGLYDMSNEKLAELLADPANKLYSMDVVEEAMHRLVNDTQFPITLATQRIWWANHPWVKLFWKFKPFGIEQTYFIYDRVLKAAARGNVAPMVRFLFWTALMGELYNILRDWLTGREESITKSLGNPDERNAKDIGWRVVQNIVDGGGVGMLADMIWGVWDWVVGPVGSSAENLARTGMDTLRQPKAAPGAIKTFFQKEFSAWKQYEGLINRLDRKLLNENNQFFEYQKWRNRAYDYKDEEAGTDVVDTLAEAIEGRPDYKRTDRSLIYELAAKQITLGDVQDAADYLSILYKQANTDEDKKALEKGIKLSMKNHSPLGKVAEKNREVFLSRFEQADRNEANVLQKQWTEAYEKAASLARQQAGLPTDSPRKEKKPARSRKVRAIY